MYFDYGQIKFRYTPFPIASAKPVMPDELYSQFVNEFPPVEMFESFEELGKKGRKYILSEKENKQAYLDFIRSKPLWRDFHAWIKSDDFVQGVLDMLQQHNIDLGYRCTPLATRWRRTLKNAVRGRRARRDVPLKARFDFSALPADGGHLVPHTDAPTKIVTMVLSIVGENEWDPSFGGATDVNWPRNECETFNYVNRLASFDDVEVIDSFPFTPNQAVLFVKTFNSWHSVSPMTGTGSDALRKTLTINIEALH